VDGFVICGTPVFGGIGQRGVTSFEGAHGERPCPGGGQGLVDAGQALSASWKVAWGTFLSEPFARLGSLAS
jgi:hypothetical protein